MIVTHEQPFHAPVKRLSDLEREDIMRQVLDEAERRILALDGNPTYRQAWKIAIKTLHGMKAKI